MATMSVAPGATTTTTTTNTLTPPSSSHGNQPGWKLSAGYRTNSMKDNQLTDSHANGSAKEPIRSQNGHLDHDPYGPDEYSLTKENQDSSRSVSNPEKKRSNRAVSKEEEDKWIHRDKLARIESEELQAAGIILPMPRSHSRPRRDRSPEKTNGRRRATDTSDQHPFSRSRKNSTLSVQTTESEAPAPAWDLRLPEEIAEDPEDKMRQYWVSSGSGKGSRIPIAKLSPAPIPPDYIERDAPISRKTNGNPLEDDVSISMPMPSRSRSSSGANALDETFKSQPAKRTAPEASPKKATANGTRKPSTREKQSASGGSKTRSTSNTRSNSATRPTTRSGEASLSTKAPEGEPPWMISAYKPDPRLPPEQQLLPTVAKRLQQEKWEQEGKFGNIYDKEFRPLNEEGFSKHPELKPQNGEERQDEWPLRTEAKSPSLSRPGTSSYSTMPKIQDKPAKSPLASPRPPQQSQMQATESVRVPDAPEETEEKSKGGCGCCIIM